MDTLQVNALVDLKTWCDDPKNNPKGTTFRTMNDRRKFVQNLGLKIIKNPKDQSECIAVLDKVIMLSGQRRSAKREKVHECEDREEAKEEFAKAASALKVESNTRVACLILILRIFFRKQ